MSEQTDTSLSSPTEHTTDAILPVTRLVAAVIIPFLVAAFIILYLLTGESGRLFAWEIASAFTAAVMGAGYLGGAYFFLRVLFEQRWHRVTAGFLPITVFTGLMLISTLAHWDIFDPTHWPFQVWLVLYLVTPFVVPLVWAINRRTDPQTYEAQDHVMPKGVRQAMLFIGIALLLGVAVLMLAPQVGINIWPWQMTPLTMRVLAGWLALLGSGAISLATQARWSVWRIPLQTILLWQSLVLLAAVIHRSAFGESGLGNWYVLYTVAGIAGATAIYVYGIRGQKSTG